MATTETVVNENEELKDTTLISELKERVKSKMAKDLFEASAGVKTLDPSSSEDTNLYQDASGKGAKIDTDKGTEGKDKANKKSIAAKGQAAGGQGKDETQTIDTPDPDRDAKTVSEHLDNLFSGEQLSEDFKEKATVVFEAAINERVSSIQESLNVEYKELLETTLETTIVELTEKLDEYLEYVISEWMNNNELALERGIKSDIAESFLVGLKDLFENHYIDIPDEKYNVVDELFESNEDLKKELNSQIEKNLELSRNLSEQKASEIFMDVSNDLVDTQIEKFATLAEGVEFESTEQFKRKLEIIKETYFKDTQSSNDDLVEEVDTRTARRASGSPEAVSNTLMEGYLSRLNFENRNKK
jgi:hypothetical protein